MRKFIFASIISIACADVLSQNYYVQITNDLQTTVADVAPTDILHYAKLIAYNTIESNQDADMRLLALDNSNSVLMSAKLHVVNKKLEAVKIMTKSHFVLAQVTDLVTQAVAPVIIELDILGNIVSSRQLPALPAGYQYLKVYDLIETNVRDEMRVLCTATDNANAIHIFDQVYSNTSFQSTFTRYSPQESFTDYGHLGYIKHYHESEEMLGEISFYGSPMTSVGRKGFVYYKGYSVPYVAETYRAVGIENSSFVVNGISQGTCSYDQITMVFQYGMDGEFCLQQKCQGLTLNWRKFYKPQDEIPAYFGYGRGGHGVKEGLTSKANYIIGSTGTMPTNGKLFTLRYDETNGSLYSSRIYNLTSPHAKLGWPNFTDDPGSPFYFVVDRYNQINGFKMVDADAANDEPACTEKKKFIEVDGSIIESPLLFQIVNYTYATSSSLGLTQTFPSVTISIECNSEQKVTVPATLVVVN